MQAREVRPDVVVPHLKVSQIVDILGLVCQTVEAEEVLDRLQQSLMCIRSTFKGLSVHKHKRFLTKDSLSLKDKRYNF